LSQTDKKFAALAPLMAIAGIFAHPVASTVLPLLVFFIFYWRKMEQAQLIALRAADLAFTAQMFIVMMSLLFAGFISLYSSIQFNIHQLFTLVTILVLVYVIGSLLTATIMAFRGKTFNHFLSLKLSERIYIALSKKNKSN